MIRQATAMVGRVCAIVSAECGEVVTPDTTFESLGIDSLDFLCLIAAIQEIMGTNLPKERFSGAETVGQLAALFE